MEPGVLHSIAAIAHASVQLLVEINFKKVKVINVFVLFLHDNGMIWTGNVLSSTMEPGAIKQTTPSCDQCDSEAVSKARLNSLRPLALYILFVLRGYLWWISMVFAYTGVFSEYNIIIHYNSVKKHQYRLFADGDSTMFQLTSMLPMFDVYIGRNLINILG